MQKKKIYIFVSILVVIMFFSVAALCGQCSLTPGTTTETTEESKDTKEVEETEETEETKETETTEAVSGEKTKPTIKLEVYQGPTYAEDSGFCWVRVEAKVTGNPKPKVEFSKDDSDHAWGDYKVQINLENPGDTYTLEATATNSEGSDDDSILIEWGCDEEVTEPTSAPVEVNADIAVDKSLSGYIIVDDAAFVNPPSYVFVGDYTNDKQIKTYLTFKINDISSLDEVTIKSTSLSMPVDDIIGHPELMPAVHVKVFNYGDTLELADQGAGGDFVKIFPTSDSMTSFDFSSTDLVAKLQTAVDSNSARIQLKISLEGINVDGVGDWYRFILGNIVLHVKYETPG